MPIGVAGRARRRAGRGRDRYRVYLLPNVPAPLSAAHAFTTARRVRPSLQNAPWPRARLPPVPAAFCRGCCPAPPAPPRPPTRATSPRWGSHPRRADGQRAAGGARARRSRVPAAGPGRRTRRGAAPLLDAARRHAAHPRGRATRGSPAAADASIDVGPAGDWLLDNFYVVQEHIREVRESLPRGYYRELPKLAGRAARRLSARLRDRDRADRAHRGRIDLDERRAVRRRVPGVTPLSIGELWAMPAMLRLGLIESVRRMALRTVQRLDEVRGGGRLGVRASCARATRRPTAAAALNEFVAASAAHAGVRHALPAADPLGRQSRRSCGSSSGSPRKG